MSKEELKERLGEFEYDMTWEKYEHDVFPKLPNYMDKVMLLFPKEKYGYDKYVSGIPSIVYRRDKLFLTYIDADEYGITFASSPCKAFDRWANSRHICFTIYYSWFEHGYWKKGLKKGMKKTKHLSKKIPLDYWSNGMTVQL